MQQISSVPVIIKTHRMIDKREFVYERHFTSDKTIAAICAEYAVDSRVQEDLTMYFCTPNLSNLIPVPVKYNNLSLQKLIEKLCEKYEITSKDLELWMDWSLAKQNKRQIMAHSFGLELPSVEDLQKQVEFLGSETPSLLSKLSASEVDFDRKTGKEEQRAVAAGFRKYIKVAQQRLKTKSTNYDHISFVVDSAKKGSYEISTMFGVSGLTGKFGAMSFLEPHVVVKNENIVFRAKKLSLDASWSCPKKDERIAILALANPCAPGGELAVMSECSQETDIFHRTNAAELVPATYHNLYDENGCLVRSGLVCMGSVYTVAGVQPLDAEGKPNADLPMYMIVALAPDLSRAWVENKEDHMWFKDEYIQIVSCGVRLIIDSAIEAKCTKLILSSLGCGAFGNNPYLVAAIFRLVLEEKQPEMHGAGLTVEFAIEEKDVPSGLGAIGTIFTQILNGSSAAAMNLIHDPLVAPCEKYYQVANIHLGRPPRSVAQNYFTDIEYFRSLVKGTISAKNLSEADQKRLSDLLVTLFPLDLIRNNAAERNAIVQNQNVIDACWENINLFISITKKYPQCVRLVSEQINAFTRLVFNLDCVEFWFMHGKAAEEFYASLNYRQIKQHLPYIDTSVYSFSWAQTAFPVYGEILTAMYLLTQPKFAQEYREFFGLTLKCVCGLSMQVDGGLNGVLQLTENDSEKLRFILRMIDSAKIFHLTSTAKILEIYLKNYFLHNWRNPDGSAGPAAQLCKNYLSQSVERWMIVAAKQERWSLGSSDVRKQRQEILCGLQNIEKQSVESLRSLMISIGQQQECSGVYTLSQLLQIIATFLPADDELRAAAAKLNIAPAQAAP